MYIHNNHLMDGRWCSRTVSESANILSTNPMARVDFPRPRELNVRVPRGTEAGANSQWMPGGYLPRGQLEAVFGLGAAKPGGLYYDAGGDWGQRGK